MNPVLRDQFRRLRPVVAMYLAVVTAIWVAALRLGVPSGFVRLAYALSFFIEVHAFFLVTAGPESPRRLRLLHALPVRRAGLGASVWLLGVIGPPLVTTAAKFLAVGIVRALSIATPIDVRWLLCSGVFDIAFVGSVCWFQPRILRLGLRIPIGRLITRVYWLLGVIVCLPFGAALALAFYMPSGWDQWRWHTGLALVALLALTIASRFEAARLVGSAPAWVPRVAPPPDRTITPAARVPFDSRLSGIRRMLWLQFRNAAITSVSVMSLLVVMVSLPWPKTESLLTILREAMAEMSTDAGARIWTLGYVLHYTIGMQRWQPYKFPLLRALPMSARELILTLLARTVVTCVAFWLGLLAMFLLSPVATHPWMGLGSLVGLIGATSLTSAAMWRWHKSPLTNFAALGVNYVLQFARPWQYIRPGAISPVEVQWIALVLGACGIVAAMRWNNRLIHSKGTGR